MYKPKLLLPAIAGMLLIAVNAVSQTDTTRLDLGRIHLTKEFTQTVTIKGDDLARYPFSDLADAINVWLYGVNSNRATLQYVIEGVMVTDVNTYPIQDIEDITLVQSALTQVSNNRAQRNLVLIRLKKNRSQPYGISASSLTNFTNLKNPLPGTMKNSNIFYNYYVSGFRNIGKAHIGASVNYLHDEQNYITRPNIPLSLPYASYTYGPLSSSRLRTNLYFTSPAGKLGDFNVNAGYTSQQIRYQSSVYYLGALENTVVQRPAQGTFNITGQLTSRLGHGFINQLKGGYSINTADGTIASSLTVPAPLLPVDNFTSKYRMNVITDELRYTTTAGGLTIEPSVSISRHSASLDSSYISNGVREYRYWEKYRGKWILTPMISLSLNKSLNLTGGISNRLSGSDKKIYPFASLSANVLSMLAPEQRAADLNIFVSFTKANGVDDRIAPLYNYTSIPYSGIYPNTTSLQPTSPYAYTSYVSGNPYADVTALNAGATLGLISGKLKLNYTFDKREFNQNVTFNGPQTTYLIYSDVKYRSHRVGADVAIVNEARLKFRTGINASMVHFNSAYTPYQYYPVTSALPAVVLADVGNKIWSGGWVNRLEAGKAFAGLDMLYETGGMNYGSTEKITSVSLQNLYAGYGLSVAGLKKLEVFASGRNIWQNKKSIITDNRRFFGLGIHASF